MIIVEISNESKALSMKREQYQLEIRKESK
jgi:hypothetical protein